MMGFAWGRDLKNEERSTLDGSRRSAEVGGGDWMLVCSYRRRTLRVVGDVGRKRRKSKYSTVLKTGPSVDSSCLRHTQDATLQALHGIRRVNDFANRKVTSTWRCVGGQFP